MFKKKASINPVDANVKYWYDRMIGNYILSSGRLYGYLPNVQYLVRQIVKEYENIYTEEDIAKIISENIKLERNIYDLLQNTPYYKYASAEEKKVLSQDEYPEKLEFVADEIAVSFILSKKGDIESRSIINYGHDKVANFSVYTSLSTLNNIKDVLVMLQNNKVNFSSESWVQKIFEKASEKSIANNSLFSCAMMQMILKEESGYKRALVFASEYGLDMQIPMIYGSNKENNQEVLNYYLTKGGNPALKCLNKNGKLTISLKRSKNI